MVHSPRNSPSRASLYIVHLKPLPNGSVQSNIITSPADFTRPTSDEYATHVVTALGSGRAEVIPYVGHWIGLTITRSLPNFILRHLLGAGAWGLFIMEAMRQGRLQDEENARLLSHLEGIDKEHRPSGVGPGAAFQGFHRTYTTVYYERFTHPSRS